MRRSTQTQFASCFLAKRSLLLVTAASILGVMTGCAQILGFQDLPSDRDAGPTPPPDAEPLDPGEFGITGVEPFTVLEGEGAAWAVPVIVTGQELDTTTRVVLNGAGFAQLEVPAVVATDGKSLAFPLSVPVLTAVGRGSTAMINVTVRRGGLSAMTNIAVTGLNELDTAQLGDTTLEASDLEPLYSRIVIDRDITLSGTEPVRLVATSEIRLEAIITADGQDATGEIPGQGGPGGCAGGAIQEDAPCGVGGGKGNTRDDGGGGGGHFTSGTPGGGTPPSPGGMATGRPDLVPLANEGGNGGGGSAQGAGGGGGGIVELTSRGTFVVDGDGSISADGGRGGAGQCSGASVAGSGGGGSGGTILVRAWRDFDDQVNAPRLSVLGGEGGDMPPDEDCVEAGGAGSFGRVRVDTAGLSGLPGFAEVTPDPFQGPLLRSIGSGGLPVPVITSQQQIMLEVVGGRGESYFLDINGSVQSFATSSAGTASLPVTLRPGRNTICAKTQDDTLVDVSEGVQCISIVSIQ